MFLLVALQRDLQAAFQIFIARDIAGVELGGAPVVERMTDDVTVAQGSASASVRSAHSMADELC